MYIYIYTYIHMYICIYDGISKPALRALLPDVVDQGPPEALVLDQERVTTNSINTYCTNTSTMKTLL